MLLVAYLFQLWARHHRRLMIHRERLVALEKGVEPPPLVEEEIERTAWNVQRVILLAGLCWLSVGIALFGAINELSGQTLRIPWGIENSTGQTIFVEIPLRELPDLLRAEVRPRAARESMPNSDRLSV